MPDDLNNKMDEMLRNYAQQRRNVPDRQMHPATRKMLQGEVARLHKKEEKKPGFLAKMGRFWPQYAIGLAAVVVLLGVILPGQLGSKSKLKANKPAVIQTTSESDKEQRSEAAAPSAQAPSELYFKKENQLAQEAQPAQPAQLKDQVADTKLKEVERLDGPAPTSQESVGRERQLAEIPAQTPVMKKAGAANRDEAGVVLNAPAPANRGASLATKNDELARRYAPALDAAASAQNESSVDKLAKQSTLALTPAESKPTSLAAMKRASDLANLGNALRSKFVQISTNQIAAGGAIATGTVSPVLASFQLEQLGEKLRFVDRDGSVYSGQVLTNVPPAAEEAKQVVAQSDVRLRVPPQQSINGLGAVSQQQPQNLFLENALVNNFRASGMNVTLGKDVVISGQLYERTNQSAAEKSAYQNQQNVVIGNRVQAYGFNQQQLNQVSQASRAIVGTAVVGNTNEVPIQAISNE